MEGIEMSEEWDTEEFQTALKVVLKYEIQSLLERLSETGEETVVLTANTDELCVGHLASPNARKFLNTDDMGNMKNKFLYFLTGSSKVLQKGPEVRPPGAPAGRGQGGGGYSDSELGNKKQDSHPSIQGKTGVKRPGEFSSMSQNFQQQQADAKRLKLDQSVVATTQVMKAPVVARPVSNQNLPQMPSADNGKFVQKGPRKPAEVKLNTTKVISRSGGFTEERLSNAEFQKLLQHNIDSSSDSEGGAEDYEDFDDEEHLEEGEIRFPPSSQGHFHPAMSHPASKTPCSKNIAYSAMPAPRNALVTSTPQGVPGTPVNQLANVQKPNTRINNKKEVVESRNKSDIVLAANCSGPDVAPGKRQASQVSDKDVRVSEVQGGIKEEKDPGDLEYKQSEQMQATQANVSVKSEPKLKVELNKMTGDSVPTQKTDKPQLSLALASQQTRKDRLACSDDEMDTETLIRITKEKHKENMSEADRAIQDKLGLLSSKLSWIVEYPKDSPTSQAQTFPNQGIPHVSYHGDGEEDEEEDEEYDEDEFDEEGLDEEDRAALRQMREQREKAMREAEGYRGEGMGGDYDEEEGGYGEMEDIEEREFEEYEDYSEEMGLHGDHMGMGEEGMGYGDQNYEGQGQQHYMEGSVSGMQQGQNYHPAGGYQIENFIVMGPILVKCMICNKIVRKALMKQHNQVHIEEMEEEEEEDLGEVGEEEDGEFHEMSGEYEEAEDEADAMPEFTAEKLIAEKVVVQDKEKKPEKPTKSTVCDICNKTYKTHTNMLRHRKLHSESKGVTCPVCSKNFKIEQYLSKHMKKAHPKYKEVGGEEEDTKAEFSCGVCQQECPDEESLNNHMKSHT